MWESQTILQDAGPTQHCQGVQQNPPLTLGRRLPECWCHHTKLPDPTGLRCSLTQLCPALWDPMGCSTPGFPVLHHLPVCSNSGPLSWWCHPTVSSSVTPFSCPQSFPASGSFPMSQLFTSGGQSTGVSASASVLPMNTQDWSHLGWTGQISLQSKGLSRVFSNTTVQKHQFFGAQFSSQSNCHIHTWPLEKP